MNIKKSILLERKLEKSILIDAHYSKTHKHQTVIIFCHGYKGFKDWGAWEIMANTFAEKGYCFIKFNFSYNGCTPEQPSDFKDLEAFGHNNYSKELDDLEAVINWVTNYFKENPLININSITLIGHSRGGGIALIKSAENPKIMALITLASVSDFSTRFGTKEDIITWKKNNVKYALNGRTKQKMPHYYQFYEDYVTNLERFNIKHASKKLKIPQVIIHGKDDNSVKLNEAQNLKEWRPEAQLKIIKNADHVFNTKHPWTKKEASTQLKEVISFCIAYLESLKKEH